MPESIRRSRSSPKSRLQKSLRPLKIEDSFWRQFAKSAWEKNAAVFKNIDSPLVKLDETELFSLLVLYSDRCRKLKETAGMKLYVSGHRQFESETLRHLPKTSDRTLHGYHERMSEVFPDYCLVCDELLQVAHERQDHLREFTEGLFRAVGFPNRFVEIGLYLGNYRKTPFGVHIDGCGVFSFPVAGTKTFRIWKPDYVTRHQKLERAFNYTKYKSGSQVLKAQPGDMTYWPSMDWHIAESDGQFSATWSLGIWVDQKHSSDVSEIVKELLFEGLGADASSGTTNFRSLHTVLGEVSALPDLYHRSMNALMHISSEGLEDSFLKAWMIHTSKQGFKPSPLNFAREIITLNAKSNVEIASRSNPVRWMVSKKDGKTYYCFNGAATEGLTSKRFLKLILKLNAGERVALGNVFRSWKASELGALRRLAGAGALVSST